MPGAPGDGPGGRAGVPTGLATGNPCRPGPGRLDRERQRPPARQRIVPRRQLRNPMARAALVVVRPFWLAVAGAVAAVAALVWLTWPSPGPPGGAAPTRQYRSFGACLLTDAHGVAAGPAAAAWSGLQE